jgi:hypothetical protein
VGVLSAAPFRVVIGALRHDIPLHGVLLVPDHLGPRADGHR